MVACQVTVRPGHTAPEWYRELLLRDLCSAAGTSGWQDTRRGDVLLRLHARLQLRAHP